MGKPILIKDKKQEVFDKANSTPKGRTLIKTIEQWRGDVDRLLELQEKIQEQAKECGLSVEDTKVLAHIVCDKSAWSSYYKKRFMEVFSPKFKQPDYNKLATKALMHDPIPNPSDRELYEGDYEIFIPYDVLPQRTIIHMAKGNKGWTLRIRNGKPNNAKLDTENYWSKPEDWEIEVSELASPIN